MARRSRSGTVILESELIEAGQAIFRSSVADGYCLSTKTDRNVKISIEWPSFRSCAIESLTRLHAACNYRLIVQPSFNFLSAPFDCVYIFDIRTNHACPTVPPPQASTSVSPLGVFAIIGCVALVVYFLASCIYRRRVLHKVGWAQVPHIGAFSGIFSFIKVTWPRNPLTSF